MDIAKVSIPCYFALDVGSIPPAPFTVVSSTNQHLQPTDGLALKDFVSDLASMVGSVLERLDTMKKQIGTRSSLISSIPRPSAAETRQPKDASGSQSKASADRSKGFADLFLTKYEDGEWFQVPTKKPPQQLLRKIFGSSNNPSVKVKTARKVTKEPSAWHVVLFT